MDILTLTVGVLIGVFVGVVLHSKHVKNGYAGTLVLDCSDSDASPDIYLELNKEASFLEGLDSVSMDVRVINVNSHK